MGKQLLCLSCLLHENELPFRKLFDVSDGSHGTTGPDSFGGELGKQCKNELNLEDVVEFKKISSTIEDIEEETLKTLSRDQKLLYNHIQAIKA